MEEKNSMCSNWQGDQGIESDKDNKHEKIAVIPLK
jgi:ParB family transcriptional regulator, chromosome partitioning protein